MTTPIKSIGEVALQVNDLDAMVDFYTCVVGLELPVMSPTCKAGCSAGLSRPAVESPPCGSRRAGAAVSPVSCRLTPVSAGRVLCRA